MNILVNKLLLFDSLNRQQIELIKHFTQEVYLEAGKYLSEPGSSFSQLALVKSGVLRYNYYNHRAENITSDLIGEGNFITASGPLRVPVIQSDYLQAVTASTLIILTKTGMDELSSTISTWDCLLRKIFQKAVNERSNRIIRRIGDVDPKIIAARYLARFPNIEKHIDVDQMLQYLDGWEKDQHVDDHTKK